MFTKHEQSPIHPFSTPAFVALRVVALLQLLLGQGGFTHLTGCLFIGWHRKTNNHSHLHPKPCCYSSTCSFLRCPLNSFCILWCWSMFETLLIAIESVCVVQMTNSKKIKKNKITTGDLLIMRHYWFKCIHDSQLKCYIMISLSLLNIWVFLSSAIFQRCIQYTSTSTTKPKLFDCTVVSLIIKRL